MDPQSNPTQQTTPPSYSQPPATPPNDTPPPKSGFRWPLSRKLTLLVGALLLIVIAIIVVASLSSKKNGSDSASLDSVYVERDGYPRKEIGDGIADAAALSFEKSNNVIETGQSVKVIPACAVLTFDDIKNEGLLPKANPLSGVVSRSYFDGEGNANIPYSQYSLPFMEESNYCTYALQTSVDSVSIDVYQPFLTSEAAIADEISSNYTSAAPISGLDGIQLYKGTKSSGTSENASEYLARKGDVTLKLRVALKSDREAKSQALLKKAFANLAAVQSTPVGAPTARYDSPTYKQSYLAACQFLKNDDIQLLTGTDASPLVSEKLATATGVKQFKSLGDKTNYLYIENTCSRTGTGEGVAASQTGGLVDTDQNMQVKTTSYDKAKGAEHAMKSDSDSNSNYKDVQKLSGIGDEAIAFKNNVGENIIQLRKGRYIVELTFNSASQSYGGLNDMSKMVAKLTPYAQKIANAIK